MKFFSFSSQQFPDIEDIPPGSAWTDEDFARLRDDDEDDEDGEDGDEKVDETDEEDSSNENDEEVAEPEPPVETNRRSGRNTKQSSASDVGQQARKQVLKPVLEKIALLKKGGKGPKGG
jgi:hypothetical protein